METLFLILSGAILVGGILYWLWSHIQLTQKKVQILENAVFELRGMLTAGPPLSGGGGSTPAPTPVTGSGSGPASPTKVYSDLEDDAAEEWDAEEGDGEGEIRVIREVEPVSTPLEAVVPALAVEEKPVTVVEPVGREEEIPDDLIPGGRIHIGDADAENEKQFKDLFTAPAAAPAATSARTPESLDGMPVKELRRLATQRGIQGADDMKKKEILAALRRQVTAPAAVAEEVTVEKTLDIREVFAATPAGETETVEAEILE